MSQPYDERDGVDQQPQPSGPDQEPRPYTGGDASDGRD